MFGQMASGVGRGATEVAVFGGVGYATQTNPATHSTDVAGDPVNTQTTATGFALPGIEANIQRGFTEKIGLNVHLSSAGIQPGLKWTLNRSKIFHVALLPAIGVGYGSVRTSSLVSGIDGVQTEYNPSTTTSFTFLGGLKVLFSHVSGFYLGVGYDFVYNRSNNNGITGGGNVQTGYQNLTTTGSHHIMGAVGFDVALGMVHIRPEIAFAAMPSLATTWTSVTEGSNGTQVSNGGGFGWMILPGFSIAVASPAVAKSDEEVEVEHAQKRGHEDTTDADENDDDDDRPKLKKHHDDEEGEKPARRRKSSDDDERD
jgi:hypothetical protein